jgi:hypothetical protein
LWSKRQLAGLGSQTLFIRELLMPHVDEEFLSRVRGKINYGDK